MANLRKRVNGRGSTHWQVRWRNGFEEVSQSFPTEAEATVFRGLVDAAGQRFPEGWVPGRGFAQAPSTPTLAEWFDRDMDARSGANNRTQLDYRRDFATHVPPWLASRPIDRIGREDVGKWLTALQRTLAPKTVHNLHGMVSSVMKNAQADGLVRINPFAGRSKPVRVKREEMVFLTPAEFATLRSHMSVFYQPLVTFLFGTGLRWSEATALTVKRVDLAGARIHVVTAWKRQPGGAPLSLDPKTDASYRTVTLTPRLVEMLASLVAGKGANELVFVNRAGHRIMNGTFWNHHWNPARTKAEAEGFERHPRIHDLRHSHAAVLLSAGRPALAVSRRLGHTSTSITTGLYGHLMPEVDEGLLGSLSDAGM